jgi:SAM-dependent methyltransferase
VNRKIRTVEDLFGLLDQVFEPAADRWTQAGSGWWDEFYADRAKPVPFFEAKPDENLVAHVEGGTLAPGRVLEVGCGPGRNALYLASRGFEVDAVDLSPAAVAWAEERSRAAGLDVGFHCGDIFAGGLPGGRYSLVYDSGCLHHLPPHRRVSYLDLLGRVLLPGGHLGLVCFVAGAMGSELPDEEFYRQARLHGGVAFTPDELRWLFSDFTEIELRPMREQPPSAPVMGVPFLQTALFRRPGDS